MLGSGDWRYPILQPSSSTGSQLADVWVYQGSQCYALVLQVWNDALLPIDSLELVFGSSVDEIHASHSNFLIGTVSSSKEASNGQSDYSWRLPANSIWCSLCHTLVVPLSSHWEAYGEQQLCQDHWYVLHRLVSLARNFCTICFV